MELKRTPQRPQRSKTDTLVKNPGTTTTVAVTTIIAVEMAITRIIGMIAIEKEKEEIETTKENTSQTDERKNATGIETNVPSSKRSSTPSASKLRRGPVDLESIP